MCPSLSCPLLISSGGNPVLNLVYHIALLFISEEHLVQFIKHNFIRSIRVYVVPLELNFFPTQHFSSSLCV
jgi:hypothetical protein